MRLHERAELLVVFLQAFAPRKLCVPCLGKLLNEGALKADAVDRLLRDAGVRMAHGRCLNCDEDAPLYGVDA